jgi:hypothetical protein
MSGCSSWTTLDTMMAVSYTKLSMKPIRLTQHARERCVQRGATEDDVREAILSGSREPTRKRRQMCRLNIEFGKEWQGTTYPIKQVAPVIAETDDEITVITVFVFYF